MIFSNNQTTSKTTKYSSVRKGDINNLPSLSTCWWSITKKPLPLTLLEPSFHFAYPKHRKLLMQPNQENNRWSETKLSSKPQLTTNLYWWTFQFSPHYCLCYYRQVPHPIHHRHLPMRVYHQSWKDIATINKIV